MRKGKWVRKIVKDTEANLLTKFVVNHILHDGWSASRINTTGIWVEEKQCYMSGGGRNGFSDVVCCINGKAVAIEIKIGNDSIRKDQRIFRHEWVSAGGVYLTVKNEEGFLSDYNVFFKQD